MLKLAVLRSTAIRATLISGTTVVSVPITPADRVLVRSLGHEDRMFDIDRVEVQATN